jgi:isoamylase
MLFSGTGITDHGPRGETQRDDDFLLLFNAFHDTLPFSIPSLAGRHWSRMIDTARTDLESILQAERIYPLQGRSLALLRRQLEPKLP